MLKNMHHLHSFYSAVTRRSVKSVRDHLAVRLRATDTTFQFASCHQHTVIQQKACFCHSPQALCVGRPHTCRPPADLFKQGLMSTGTREKCHVLP